MKEQFVGSPAGYVQRFGIEPFRLILHSRKQMDVLKSLITYFGKVSLQLDATRSLIETVPFTSVNRK